MLDGFRILVVEDNPIIAMDLEMTLRGAGGTVIGPFHALPDLAALCVHPDAAVLDIELEEGTVFPIAERLRADGVPILFHTGFRNTSYVRFHYPRASIHMKPALPEDILSSLEDLVRTVH